MNKDKSKATVLVIVVGFLMVFYLVLFPFAMIQRLTEHDPLLLSPDRDTFWVENEEKETDPKSFEKTW